MYLYLELWSAREPWLRMSKDERKAFFKSVESVVAEMGESGSEMIAVALNDDDTDRRADYEYLALWRMPDKETALEFERIIGGLGWYELFHQENMRGADIPAEDCLAHMVDR